MVIPGHAAGEGCSGLGQALFIRISLSPSFSVFYVSSCYDELALASEKRRLPSWKFAKHYQNRIDRICKGESREIYSRKLKNLGAKVSVRRKVRNKVCCAYMPDARRWRQKREFWKVTSEGSRSRRCSRQFRIKNMKMMSDI